jgi:hypothetical protein
MGGSHDRACTGCLHGNHDPAVCLNQLVPGGFAIASNGTKEEGLIPFAQACPITSVLFTDARRSAPRISFQNRTQLTLAVLSIFLSLRRCGHQHVSLLKEMRQGTKDFLLFSDSPSCIFV